MASTAFVMLTLWCVEKSSVQTARSDLVVVACGILALFFRQTNIFWVAIFPAGISVVERLKTAESSSDIDINDNHQRDYVAHLERSWKQGVIHDPPCGDAAFEGIDQE